MAATIPQFDICRQTAEIRDEVDAAVSRVISSGRYVLGPENEALEAEVGEYLGVRNAIACASGTDALHLVLRALGITRGHTVITSPFTFFATVGAILLTGADVRFCDIDGHTFNISEESVQRVLSDRRLGHEHIAAVLPVHLYGRPAAMKELQRSALGAGLPVIEDAAQAFGGTATILPGAPPRYAGTIGVAGCFSFYPTKNLGAAGEAGMVVTDDDDLATRIRMIRVHGSARRYEHELLGWNARLDEMQAAILRVKLRHVSAWNRRRRQIAALYGQHLAGVPVVVPEIVDGHVFHQYVIRARRRDELRAWLTEQQIGSDIYYPIPAHLQPVMRGRGFKPGAFLEAEKAAREVVALPMFPELTDEEVERVAWAVRKFYS